MTSCSFQTKQPRTRQHMYFIFQEIKITKPRLVYCLELTWRPSNFTQTSPSYFLLKVALFCSPLLYHHRTFPHNVTSSSPPDSPPEICQPQLHVFFWADTELSRGVSVSDLLAFMSLANIKPFLAPLSSKIMFFPHKKLIKIAFSQEILPHNNGESCCHIFLMSLFAQILCTVEEIHHGGGTETSFYTHSSLKSDRMQCS